MHLHRPVVLACLPVPEPQLTFSIAWAQELPIWRELETASVAWVEMSCELLFTVHLKVSLAVVYHDLVVHGLSSEVFHVRMHGGSWDGVHVGLADMLCHDRDSKLPDVDLLVICSWYEASSVLNEGYAINWAKVLLILLHDFFRVCVELEDLLVGTTG